MRRSCRNLHCLVGSLLWPFGCATDGAVGNTPSLEDGTAETQTVGTAIDGAAAESAMPTEASSMVPADEASSVAEGARADASIDITTAASTDSPDDAAGDADAFPDAFTAAGSDTCAGLFCEDFEQGVIDPAKWDIDLGAGGTLDVQQQIVAHGHYAMHVHGLAGPPADYALIVSKNAPAALRGTHFGRANFFITPKPLTSGHTQMVFGGTNGTGSANGPGPLPKLRYMEVANINGGWQLGFDLLDVSPLIEEVAYPAGSPQVPTTTWTCLEWEFSDQPDVVHLWVDGQDIGIFDNEHVSYPSGHVPGSPLYAGTSSGLIGTFSVFGFGFHDWHPNKPFDLYYDDIGLDIQRVGCLASQDP